MITYSKWNDPGTYARVTQELLSMPIPTEAAFAARKDERIVHTFASFKQVSVDELNDILDDTDQVILEAVALAKFLTSRQMYEFAHLRGHDVSRPYLRKKILKLMKLRVLQENEIVGPTSERGIKYYELDYFGYLLARGRGMLFHMGNRYVPYSRRKLLGLQDDTPCDVKRILAGNQIILGLLLSKAKMDRFGIMETMRVDKEMQADSVCMIRTTVNVRIDSESILAFEVVRDTPEAYEKLEDKVKRYYLLVNNGEYLQQNFHGDTAYPQLILCGESLEHNKKIADFLRKCGLWNSEDPILFTEDLLNIRNSLSAIYGLDENNMQYWYSLPAESAEADIA